MPEITVIIPAYNVSKFISTAIASVLGQTFSDLELIVVDDGSTDNTKDVVAGFDDARLKYLCQENRGSAAARNLGLKHAKGGYVAFLDADDFWVPQKLDCQVKTIEGLKTAGAVYCNALIHLLDREANVRKRRYYLRFEFPDEELCVSLMFENLVFGSASSILVRKKCFEKVGHFDENLAYCQDLDMWRRIALEYDFLFLDEPLVVIRKHESNMTLDSSRVLSGFSQYLSKLESSLPDRYQHYLPQIKSYNHVRMSRLLFSSRNYSRSFQQAMKFLLYAGKDPSAFMKCVQRLFKIWRLKRETKLREALLPAGKADNL